MEGLENGLYLACTFHLETERDAYLSSLAQLSGLSSISNLKTKNILAIKSLLRIASGLGEYLNDSWLIVMRTVSQIEKLIYTLHADIGDDSKVAEDDLVDSNGQTIYSQYNQQVMSLLSDPNSDEVINEITGEGMSILIHQLFSQSVSLSANSIIQLFNSMCSVSLEETGYSPSKEDDIQRRKSELFESMKDLTPNRVQPYIFLLRKVVEVAYYNIDRIRLEWAQIWKILQRLFNILGCHDNIVIATYAIDSFSQLCMKFLEKDELANYNTQSQFLKSFEWIMRRTRTPSTRVLIITLIEQMISAKSRNIKSGWSSILVTLSNVCHLPESESGIVLKSFSLLQSIHKDYFDIIVNSGTFTDFVSCATEFALMQEIGKPRDDILSHALDLLQECTKFLMTSSTLDTKPFSRRGSMLSFISVSNVGQISDDFTNDRKHDDVFYLKWFPVLSAYSRIALDSRSDVTQSQGLDNLFSTLHDTAPLFDTAYWKNIMKSVIRPLFENLEDEDMNGNTVRRESDSSRRPSERSSILIQGSLNIINFSYI